MVIFHSYVKLPEGILYVLSPQGGALDHERKVGAKNSNFTRVYGGYSYTIPMI